MRVIAGEYKGRRLTSPMDDRVRPTTDKVKEAIFSILMNEVYGSNVLDLFSGTGNLGLEALSRGAEHCWFCDSSRDSIKLIKHNISYCRADERSTVMAGDFRKVLARISDPMDIILLDPPYDMGLLPECFELIEEYDILDENGLILAEHRKEEVLPEQIGKFVRVKERKYGKVVISIYGIPHEEDDDDM